jgi:hypothetical protein
MWSSVDFVMTLANYFILSNNDAPNHRVRLHPALPFASFFTGKLHEILICTGHGWCEFSAFNVGLVIRW